MDEEHLTWEEIYTSIRMNEKRAIVRGLWWGDFNNKTTFLFIGLMEFE